MKKTSIYAAAWALPFFALAADFDGSYITQVIALLKTSVASLIPIMIGLAIVVFAWGLIQYIWAGSDDLKTKGRSMMIWGVVAIAVLVSIWGIVALLQDITGTDGGSNVTIPVVTGLN